MGAQGLKQSPHIELNGESLKDFCHMLNTGGIAWTISGWIHPCSGIARALLQVLEQILHPDYTSIH